MKNENEKRIYGVNAKYVFFVLLGILLFPSLFFVAKSYTQLNTIMSTLNSPLNLNTPTLLMSNLNSTDLVDYKIQVQASLEHDVMVYRHQRATAFLATRTWMRFMSLIFGSILVVIGSAFVLGKISAPSFTGELSYKEVGASVATSSPGLILVLCGMFLIAIPNLSSQRINVDDTSSYVSKGTEVTNPDINHMNSVISEIRKNKNL